MKQKNKQIGPNCMAIDKQRRIRLSERIIREFGINKSENIILTLDHRNSLLAFKNNESIKNYAKTIAEKEPISKIESEFLLFSRKINLKLDQRCRIAIPENMLSTAGLDDNAKVIDYGDRLEFLDPEKSEARIEDILKKLNL